MATATEKIPVLSAEAATAFDLYQQKRASASRADRTARRAKADRDTALETVRGEMGEHRLARLPDGRTIVANEQTRQRKPQPASEYSWWELSTV